MHELAQERCVEQISFKTYRVTGSEGVRELWMSTVNNLETEDFTVTR